jgi:hypothetical protein
MTYTPSPGFVTGTSSEYLGQRPLRKIFRERPVVVILGPAGSGKTSVARRIAAEAGAEPLYIDTAALADAVVHCARNGKWAARLITAPRLVLDGPSYLHKRPGVVGLLLALLALRSEAGRHTVVCDASGDGSVEELLARAPIGSAAVLGLRLPSSRSGRLRFARRLCQTLDLPRTLAQGTEALEPWGYAAVAQALREKAAGQEGG